MRRQRLRGPLIPLGIPTESAALPPATGRALWLEGGAIFGGAALSIVGVLLFANGRHKEAYAMGIGATLLTATVAFSRLASP